MASCCSHGPHVGPGGSKKHDEEVRQEDIIKYNPEMIGPVPGTEVEEEGPGSLTSVKKRKQDASPGAIEVGVEVCPVKSEEKGVSCY